MQYFNNNMNQETETKINKFLNTFSDNQKCIEYIINYAKELLDDLKENESKKYLVDYLLDFFDEDETPFGKTFNKIYKMPTNIKKTIKSLELTSFTNIDDENDNYVEAVVKINNFKVYTYSDYRRSGHKTGGKLFVKISLGANILKFENEYDFIPDRHDTNRLNNIYKKIKNDKKINEILTKMQLESGLDEIIFEGFFKLLCCIPKIFNGYIY